MFFKIIFYGVFFYTTHTVAQLPDSLSLAYVLEQTKTADIKAKQQQLAILDKQFSYQKLTDSHKLDVNLFTQIGLREEFNQTVDDHELYLKLNKKLFSRQNDIEQLTLNQSIDIEKLQLNQLFLEQKLVAIKAFFTIILADKKYDHQTQKLALSAVRERHAEEDLLIGKSSELQVFKARYQTQKDFNDRVIIENQQLSKRTQLANIMQLTYPDRPNNLISPNLTHYFDYPVADEQYWHKLITKNNPTLKIFRANIKRLKQAKKSYLSINPIKISAYGQFGAQTYNRVKNGNYQLGISLDIPLSNRESEQKIQRITLDINKEALELENYYRLLTTKVLNLFLSLKQAKHLKTTLVNKQQYLDFNLERASLEYEMRLTRDIGNAMVLWTKNVFDQVQNDFNIATYLEQLNLLSGGIIYERPLYKYK